MIFFSFSQMRKLTFRKVKYLLKTTLLMRDRTQTRTLGLHTTLTHEESTSTAYSLKSPQLNLQRPRWLNGPITWPTDLAAVTAALRALRPHQELRPCTHHHQNRTQHSPLPHLLAFGSFFCAPCSRLLISLKEVQFIRETWE